jgi:hypothetical protein
MLDAVVVRTQRPEVRLGGPTASVIVVGVIRVGGVRPVSATDERAGAVADLGVPSQRGTRSAGVRAGIEVEMSGAGGGVLRSDIRE